MAEVHKEGASTGPRLIDVGCCGVCHTTRPSLAVRHLSPEVLVVRCVDCDVHALYPKPSAAELQKYYAGYYLTRAEDEFRQQRLIDLHAPVVDFLLGMLPDGRPHAFLDYGFGNGAFLQQVAKRGHLAHGADISVGNVRHLAESSESKGLDIRVVHLVSEHLSVLEPLRFDVVTLFQVIEHMIDPLDLIRDLANFQRPGDLLYIECPNNAAVLARIKNLIDPLLPRKLTWGSLKYPEHLYGFTKHSLSRLLEAGGYQLEICRDYAYCDGIHQVEGKYWWAYLSEKKKTYSLYDLARTAIPAFDRLMSWMVGGGSGIYALGRKRG